MAAETLGGVYEGCMSVFGSDYVFMTYTLCMYIFVDTYIYIYIYICIYICMHVCMYVWMESSLDQFMLLWGDSPQHYTTGRAEVQGLGIRGSVSGVYSLGS